MIPFYVGANECPYYNGRLSAGSTIDRGVSEMRFLVRGELSAPEAAQGALDELLLAGFTQDQVAFRSRLTDGYRDIPSFHDYDPVGAARLSGRVSVSMSATGFNLVGNSTLADTSLGDIPVLLEELASNEASVEGATAPEVRIDALVRTYDQYPAEIARDVLTRAGAQNVRIIQAE